MIDKSKIAIVSTVINFDLYKKSAKYFPEGIRKYVIDGRNGMHGIYSLLYMFKKLPLHNIEWVIMADEDVFFYNSNKVFQIIDQMNKDEYDVCGVRDGGVIKHRNYNPFVINTFFSILNLKNIKPIFNKRNILRNQYIEENEFNDNLNGLSYIYKPMSMYEPYYCFYFWLRRKSLNILFLESKMESDQISNSVFFNNEKVLTHTWYARSYGLNEKHTIRINMYLNSLKKIQVSKVEFEIFKDNFFKLKTDFKKILKKIKIKFEEIK